MLFVQEQLYGSAGRFYDQLDGLMNFNMIDSVM